MIDIDKRRLSIIIFLVLVFSISVYLNNFHIDVIGTQEIYTTDSVPNVTVSRSNTSLDSDFEVISPYNDIDFEDVEQLKSSLHSHTTASDGDMEPDESVEMHEEHGFDVLAITDHWISVYDHLDSEDSEMLILPGVEPSHDDRLYSADGHHTVVLFTDMDTAEKVWWFERSSPAGWTLSFEKTMRVVANEIEHPVTGEMHDGIQFFAHPEWHDDKGTGREWSWYKHYLDKYEHLQGLEIVNSEENNYSEYNAEIFDNLLEHYGSERKVYGFGVTDTHDEYVNEAWTIVLAEEDSEENVRESIEEGRMFFVQNLDHNEPPRINDIDIGNESIELDIEGGYEEVRWIHSNEVKQTGERFDLNQVDNENYVRFEVWTGQDSDHSDIVGSQAFYFTNQD